jgi:hypothetical protein
MTLPLTPDILRTSYNYLSTTPPFDKWNLPDGDDIVFKVVTSIKLRGWYEIDKDNKRHTIAISSRYIGRTDSLMEVMAHEMIHLHQEHSGCNDRGEHGRAFDKLAKKVCDTHGWDLKQF